MGWKKELTTVTTFSKLAALTMMVLMPIGGFCFGLRYGKQLAVTSCPTYNCKIPTSATPTPWTIPTEEPTPTLIPAGIYESLEGYSITIPKNWKADWSSQYNELTINSPDLELEKGGYGIPLKGVFIKVFVRKGRYENIKEYAQSFDGRGEEKTAFFNNPIYRKMAGKEAVTYDWSWEGWGTSTIMFDKDKTYEIILYHAGNNKYKYISYYKALIDSFKLSE